MPNKYNLLKSDKLQLGDKTLYRIKALRSFGDVGRGDLGGYVEHEDNLSHDGNCWISGNAKVYGDAKVFRNAKVYGDARVYGTSLVHVNAEVYGNARVYGNAEVYGYARIIYSSVTSRIFTEDNKPTIEYIKASLNVLPYDGKYYLFKRVNSTDKLGVYASCYDPTFIYKDNRIMKVSNINDDYNISCGDGLHVSTASYWSEGDTTLLCEVRQKDIITCQDGKLRVRKLKVIGRCDDDRRSSGHLIVQRHG
jgi:hypothetical protein